MPVKKRISKAKVRYCETIERLIAWLPIEQTEESQSDLLSVVYFGDYPELPNDLRLRAMNVLSGWHDESEKQNNAY
jgi:hypothetical protein